MHLDKERVKGKLILLFVAIVWGFAFVFQNQAIEYMGPFTLNGLRCIIGALFLLPVIIYRSKKKNSPLTNIVLKDLNLLLLNTSAIWLE